VQFETLELQGTASGVGGWSSAYIRKGTSRRSADEELSVHHMATYPDATQALARK
jgi:hypothetical protein